MSTTFDSLISFSLFANLIHNIMSKLFLSLIPLPPLLLYQHHRYLSAKYPTESVPTHLSIASRQDHPVVGQEPGSGEDWRGCHAGDAWSAVVPLKLLDGRASASGAVPKVSTRY